MKPMCTLQRKCVTLHFVCGVTHKTHKVCDVANHLFLGTVFIQINTHKRDL